MGSSGGGGGGSGDSTNTVRYAPYIEAHHTTFLNVSEAAGITARESNPYGSYSDINFDIAFFGAGQTIANFSSLFGLHKSLLINLDTEALWVAILGNTQNNSAITDAVTAQAALIDDEIDTTVVPRFQAGMRDINSVISSSFVIGKSLIEDGRNKKVAEFAADLKYKMIPVAASRWAMRLEWNKAVVSNYLQILNFAVNTQFGEDDRNFDFAAREALWPFTVLDYERANLGALQGAISGKSSVAGASQTQRTIGGVMSGAAMGAQLSGGTPIGAVAGGLFGLAASFF